MEELRGLVIKYSQVIQRYHVQYLSGYDAIAVNELIQVLYIVVSPFDTDFKDLIV